ncbi:hypothetical protein [Paenibacillus shenyangensis]|uniref:hypothetical protein n=1 Tax=Paenibacillus sp. A9 TaxID=1284352 RepID=UPI00035C38B4|nr:hypothetical protein [Paenibacillus sp. A9]
MKDDSTVSFDDNESIYIIVPVEGNQADNETKEASEASYVFYFVKGQNGAWTLGSID